MKSSEKKKLYNNLILELQQLFIKFNELNKPIFIIINGTFSEEEKAVVNKIAVAITSKFIKLITVEEEFIKENKDKNIKILKGIWDMIPGKGKVNIIYCKECENIYRDKKTLELLKFTEKTLKEQGYILLKISLKNMDNTILKGNFINICNKNMEYNLCNIINYKLNICLKEGNLEKGNEFNSFIQCQDNIVNYLKKMDLECGIDRYKYKTRLEKLQKKISLIPDRLKKNNSSLLLIFEGWDASGKGGAIKRICTALDPTTYKIISISAPGKEERKYHYLWRFIPHVPDEGKIAIFDRSWYGRVLVERVEGFCNTREWTEAYEEINALEQILISSDVIVIKFFLHIDKKEQLKRFKGREGNKNKRWKITEEDWRNREKWNEYESVINQCINNTNTKDAPWILIEGNDKKYARIKILESIINIASERL